MSGRGSCRPKTRGQWAGYYREKSRKRKRDGSSESGSCSERVESVDVKKKRGSASDIVEITDIIVYLPNREGAKEKGKRDIILVDDIVNREGVKSTKAKGKEKEKEKEASDEGTGDEIIFLGETRFSDLEKRKEKKKGKEKVTPIEPEIKRRKGRRKNVNKCVDINEGNDDDIIFLGESYSSNCSGLKTWSGSGSKVGSVGGTSSALITYDEAAASSTSKRVKEPVCSLSSDASMEESEESSEEDNDDSEDEDFRMNDSSSSEQADALSSDGSEDLDEKGKVEDKNVVAEEDSDNLGTKAVDSKALKKDADTEKQQGLAYRLRSRANSKAVEVRQEVCVSENVDSDSSLHEESPEKKVEKGKKVVQKQTKMSYKRAPRNLKYKLEEILLNTILEKEGRVNNTLNFAKESVLPLKFRFVDDDDDEDPPQKPESEIQIDNLFADLDMGRLQTELSSASQPVVDHGNAGHDSAACQHHAILDEQIGIVCKYCSVVFLERKQMFPEFASRPCGKQVRRVIDEAVHPDVADFEFKEDSHRNNTCMYSIETVWDIIPRHIKEKMYPHQREGFEFMWRNIGGDLSVEKLKDLPSNGGKGCIISHAPGTGKTGLSVVFLQSFMKLFPMCRPVVIAPRSMLLTWESEFKKWDADIPFHNMNDSRLSGRENVGEFQAFVRHSKNRELIRNLKLYSWWNGDGILGITYRLFEKLAGASAEDDKKRKILLECPDLLVLDEGHTPRNDETLMWQAVSKVETPRRIILSGTPFQNNFDELFNTLCLVCPEFSGSTSGSCKTFMHRGKPSKKKWNSIASCIVNNENDRKLEELKRMIDPLVHVHKGTILLEKLPGLRDTLVYLKLTDLQQKLLDMISKKNFIEKDNLMTLISVHPSLAPDLCESDVKELELDPRAGVKTAFVSELVSLSSARRERVIVFSRLIEPLMLIKKQLRSRFDWADNIEILYMDGKIEAKNRQDRITSFNDPESDAKVLLASTAACCEGINLIGASRIVLLDVVWNPSITRQAISRAYRLGQTKVVHVYNLISSTFEAKKYACQAKKGRMSELVFSAASRDENPDPEVTPSEDVILDAMLDNQSLAHMFERLVHQPKNHQILWNE